MTEPLKKPSKEALEFVAALAQKSEVLSYTPTVHEINVRLRELESMDLFNRQEWEGISSPVRQFAITTICHEKGTPEEQKDTIKFVTMHEGLLARKLSLAERYGVECVSMDDMITYLSQRHEGGESHGPASRQDQ